MVQLAAFLGNPGAEYEHNRHNAGRMLAKALPFFASLVWQKKYKGLYAAADGMSFLSAPAETEWPETKSEKIHFLMPETFMNLSGESIQAAAAFFKIKPEKIIVIHDELEIPLGTISLKFSGGLGGHNGLRSIKAVFGTADFWRLRIGIGRPSVREHPEDRGILEWVLSDFTGTETEILVPVLDAGAALLLQAITGDPHRLLPDWNKKKIASLGENDDHK